MTRPGILTLTTDFGSEGPYVAAVKGVILSLAPGTQIIDVTHAVAPQNVLEGAFVLAEIDETFPAGTVHLGVVDPGVGTDRRLIAALISGQWFVVPDNGLISGVTRLHPPESIHELVNPALRRAIVSSTFHGRDILAPAAAHLLRGGDPAELGPARSDFITLRNFRPTEDAYGPVGEVLFRDAFGNLITNIPADRLANAPPEAWTVEISGERIQGLTRTYGESPTGSLVALVGGTGWLEVAVVNGDAAQQLAAGPGATVWVRKAGGPS
jgi:S-adenosyl-L-methionine hydrolase (adenosine-forming)